MNTVPDKILYTDGHDVVVTDSFLQVKNKSYSLSGITKHGLQIIRPARGPAIFAFLLGVILTVAGLMRAIPSTSLPDFNIGGNYISANTLAIWAGLVLAALGLLIAFALKEKYAVRISTAEGEKDAVVSTQKEYIRQIVNALNEAYQFIQMKVNPDPGFSNTQYSK
jgi:hypothetical protein